MVVADTSREFQEKNEITKFGDNIGVGQFFLYKHRLKCWKVHQNWWKFVWIANIFYYFFTISNNNLVGQASDSWGDEKFTNSGEIIYKSPKKSRKKSPKLVNIYWLKIAAKLGKNQSPKTVKISMIPQKILQKYHQNWWKSDGFTRICTNFVENQGGLLYGSVIELN